MQLRIERFLVGFLIIDMRQPWMSHRVRANFVICTYVFYLLVFKQAAAMKFPVMRRYVKGPLDAILFK